VTIWVANKPVVLAIHDEQIAEHGGRPGLLDIALLESALARPQQREAYGESEPDIAALAAAYAFGIAKNHAFVEGNKRTSSVVTRTFLVLNGYDITADDLTRLEVWDQLTDGRMSEEECAEWLWKNIVKF
jgi:death on curing protein